jgi:hypothetical protein
VLVRVGVGAVFGVNGHRRHTFICHCDGELETDAIEYQCYRLEAVRIGRWKDSYEYHNHPKQL